MADTKVMREFREAVLTGIAELKTGHVNIVDRLDKVNGNIARHEIDLNSLKVADVRHDSLMTTVASLVSDVDKLKTAETKTSTQIEMTSTAAKAIWTAVGGTVILLFQHAPDLLKSIGVVATK